MLIHNKDVIEFVTEFPCFLGHPVLTSVYTYRSAYLNTVKKTEKNKILNYLGSTSFFI